MTTPDNQKALDAAKALVSQLSVSDFAMLLCGALEGDFPQSEALSDLMFENGGDDLATALGKFIGSQPCHYVAPEREYSRKGRVSDVEFDYYTAVAGPRYFA